MFGSRTKISSVSVLIYLITFTQIVIVIVTGKKQITSPARSKLHSQSENSCNLVTGLHTNLIRFITKEGFHRDVEDTLEITVTSSPIPIHYFTSGECNFAILAEFTQDVFVDPYEISHDPQLNGHIRVLNDWTDLENPAWLAESNSTVFIQLQNILTGNLISTVPVKLPIHYRYQKPMSHSRLKTKRTDRSGILNPGGYIPVTLPLPKILLRCEQWDLSLTEHNCQITKEICTSNSAKSSQCLWVVVPFKANSKSSTILIPIGDSDMQLTITCGTLLVILCGTAYLLNILRIYGMRRSDLIDNHSHRE